MLSKRTSSRNGALGTPRVGRKIREFSASQYAIAVAIIFMNLDHCMNRMICICKSYSNDHTRNLVLNGHPQHIAGCLECVNCVTTKFRSRCSVVLHEFFQIDSKCYQTGCFQYENVTLTIDFEQFDFKQRITGAFNVYRTSSYGFRCCSENDSCSYDVGCNTVN
jgi:hypothetical protein